MTTQWRVGHDILSGRLAAIPAALREAAAVEIAFVLPTVPRVVTTGIGSSAAHAKFLAHLLDGAGVPARFVPTAALAARGSDALVVFSQGLSPNARIALADLGTWARVVLVTGVPDDADLAADADGAERVGARRAAVEAGAHCIELPAGLERGTLLRFVGPMTGYVLAHRLAEAIARAAGATVPPALDIEQIVECVAAAASRAAALLATSASGILAEPLALLASGGYGELADNLRLKVLEGLLQRQPPVWDLLDFAHGPYQALFDAPATLLALTRRDASSEAALLERLAAMLDRERHRLIRLDAALPGPLAILEHEMQLDVLVLHAIAERQIDQVDWPGKKQEAPLYDVRALPEITWNLEPDTWNGESRARPRFDELTWPELETRLANGQRTAVLPLGATEQHGPHLPFATDTWIADAVAARFCERVPEAIALPALPIGCSSEHAAFSGTIDLADATLRAVLGDIVASLARHGFETIVLFSAHAGNLAALRAAGSDLVTAAAPAELLVFTDDERLRAAWYGAGASFGITPAVAGHHAGELETSIVAALRPEQVRRDRLAPGLLEVPADTQAIFYPSLRAHAPSGVVGDPRGADAARADRYLSAWVDTLVDWYHGAKKSA